MYRNCHTNSAGEFYFSDHMDFVQHTKLKNASYLSMKTIGFLNDKHSLDHNINTTMRRSGTYAYM